MVKDLNTHTNLLTKIQQTSFLISGFLFMLLIDQLASKSSGGSHQSVPSSDLESGSSPKPSPRKSRTASVSHHAHAVTWTTTLGLLVHAAADGIAMGMIFLIQTVHNRRKVYIQHFSFFFNLRIN